MEMWRKKYEEYKCPWRNWEKCLKRECPFYEDREVPITYEGWVKYHRCIRAVNESKEE